MAYLDPVNPICRSVSSNRSIRDIVCFGSEAEDDFISSVSPESSSSSSSSSSSLPPAAAASASAAS
uniref:Uncharacterized protein n=1 Tax=Arabidopsis thaliana TaxID=3702 RepID=Q0WTJ4_ARATH|nr:hypothetical protein [Arabidopsis thaliana]